MMSERDEKCEIVKCGRKQLGEGGIVERGSANARGREKRKGGRKQSSEGLARLRGCFCFAIISKTTIADNKLPTRAEVAQDA